LISAQQWSANECELFCKCEDFGAGEGNLGTLWAQFWHSEIGVLVSALFCFELGMVPGGGRTSAAVAET